MSTHNILTHSMPIGAKMAFYLLLSLPVFICKAHLCRNKTLLKIKQVSRIRAFK